MSSVSWQFPGPERIADRFLLDVSKLPTAGPMSNRVLVTGGQGFVGRILLEHLKSLNQESVFHAPETDITDLLAFRDECQSFEPTEVYHLAALANVGDSWNAASETYRVNVLGTVNVLESLRALKKLPRVLVVSSADVYGPEAMRLAGGNPVNELVATNPVSPYGGSKLAAEVAAKQACQGWGLPVVIARSFNHVGPGQADSFVVSALAKQIAEAEQSENFEILVGNLDAERDFLDVADVVRAYQVLITEGRPGSTYNVASGQAVSVASVADYLLSCSSSRLKLVVDPSRFWQVDVARIVGDTEKIHAETTWTAASDWKRGAAGCLAYWREHLKKTP
jgi:GDP-4-dehydro-6-deoxy-D-mannose reductase